MYATLCLQGDYYSYTALSDGDQAALKQDAYHFNRDYYGIMYKVCAAGHLMTVE